MSDARSRWLLPAAAVAFLFAFYWRGLDCWFFQDDFGWLHLGPAKSFSDFLNIAFAPKAHGNMRPWSENFYFYGLKALFGVNPLPFRIVVFATMSGSVFVLYEIVHRLTSSASAAFVTGLCWIASPAVAAALSWTCIYNQTQYTFFVLLALLLLIQGRYVAQTVVFVLSLGSLELAVMYPAIASLYAVLYDRSKLRRTLPLFAISAAYTILHFWIVPPYETGPYAMKFDTRILNTLGSYTLMALGPERLMHFQWTWPQWLLPAGTVVMAGCAIAAIFLARRAAILGAGIFLLLLVPLLPLPDHVMDYVLTGPAVGIALVFGSMLASRWRKTAITFCGLFLAICLPASWKVMTWSYERSLVSRNLVQGVVAYHREHPGKTLLLTGMDTDQFVAGFADLPFELYGMYDVHLAPGAELQIHDQAGIAPLYVLPPEKAEPLLRNGQAVILDVSGGRVREAAN